MGLLVTGRVRRHIDIDPTVLRALPYVQRVSDFVCEEGWTRPGQRWSGYRLGDVVRAADPDPETVYVEGGSEHFVTVLAVSELGDRVLLADRLNDLPLTEARGGPWRCVAVGGKCYQSVKRVDRMTVMTENTGDTARAIALGRLQRTAASQGRVDGVPIEGGTSGL